MRPELTFVTRLARLRFGTFDKLVVVDGNAVESGRSQKIIVNKIRENMTILRLCIFKHWVIKTEIAKKAFAKKDIARKDRGKNGAGSQFYRRNAIQRQLEQDWKSGSL